MAKTKETKRLKSSGENGVQLEVVAIADPGTPVSATTVTDGGTPLSAAKATCGGDI